MDKETVLPHFLNVIIGATIGEATQLRYFRNGYSGVFFDDFQDAFGRFLLYFLYSFLTSFLYSIKIFVKNSCKETFSPILRSRKSGLGHQIGHSRDTGANLLDQVHPGEELKDFRIAGFAHMTEVLCHDGKQAPPDW